MRLNRTTMEQIWQAKGLVNPKAIVVWELYGPLNGHIPTLPKRTKVDVKTRPKK